MTTRTHTDTFPAGTQVTLDLQPTSLTLTLTVTEPEPVEPPPPPRGPLLVGIEGPAGQETARIISGFPGVQYMREFGVKRTGESLPSLPGWTASKLAVMPATCRPHVSWKWWDPARQKAWLDSRPMSIGAPGYWPELDTTYHHEPHGDSGMTPAIYRPRGTAWATMLRDHPNGAGITNGPIVTRYWIMSGGNPADWCYDGMTTFGVDVYEPEVKAGQAPYVMTPADLWDPVLEKVYAAVPDHVDILVPEMGRRYGAGQARADALWADVEHLYRNHPRVRVVSYFNSSAFPEFAFAGTSAATVTDGGASTPEGKTWKAALAAS